MGFLDRLRGAGGDDDDGGAAREQRRDEDLARLAAGGIPASAEQRLRELAAGGTAFTSDLSVNAFALSRLHDLQPVAQVMGTCAYKVGWQNYPWGGWSSSGVATELTTISNAWNTARGNALRRLSAEAAMAGCHAVVGVTLDHHRREYMGGDLEVVVRGTAVRVPGAEQPVLTDLSLAEFTLLRQAGYAPVGIVTATSVWYVLPSWQTRNATSGWRSSMVNQELTDFTQGVYSARESAIARVTQQAERLGAHGLVGMKIDETVETREVEQNNSTRVDLIITFHAFGTAIVELGEHKSLDVRTVMKLGGK
jgi:uncharacterized protein YbjQ (UPF0145 family)